MKNTILSTLIIVLTSSFCLKKEPLNIEDGLYYGFRKNIVHKCVIVKVENSKAYIESYVLWQGVWMPSSFSKDKYYEPTILNSDKNIFKNDKIIFANYNNKYKIKLTKTFIGNIKMKLEKVKELEERTNSIRNEALLFSYNAKTFKTKEDSIAFMNLYKEFDLKHTLFLQKFKAIVD